ncbi:MAG: hypothetical protein AAGL29_12300 [Bacteroidota bacterium]
MPSPFRTRIPLVLLGLGLSTSVSGQKLVKKTVVDSENQAITIQADRCFHVEISNSNTDELIVEAEMEGEYASNLLVNLEEKGKTIFISTGFTPNFDHPNDKLSAHKVIAIALQIKIPKYKKVNVFGTSARVLVTGLYRNLGVVLADGECILDNVGETIEVKTQNGNIRVVSGSGICEASSDYGQVLGSLDTKGNAMFNLHSKEGNIYLNKTK